MKRILTVLAATLLLTAAMAGTASASSYDSVAEELSAIGVFRGTAGGFELDRAPTRSEAAIMLVRLYGAEDEAKAAYEAGETVQGVCPEGWHIPSQAEWQQLAQYVLDADMAAVGSNGEVDETAIAKALAMDYPDDELMWNLPSMIEGDPQPTWPGIDKSKNNATKFSGIPIGFRSYSFNPADGGVQWDHASYSAGWWSSTQGVMGEGFCAVVRMWSDNQRFATDSNFIGGVGLTVRCLQD